MSDRHVLPPYSLRMTADLRKKLEASANKIKRSLNGEIVARLEDSYQRELDFWIQTGATQPKERLEANSKLPESTQKAIAELESAKAKIELAIIALSKG